ncbi:cAMP phosphodiesterases class-II-domain-containing protein [Terfezia claveryi]|nr:cAMP phosphodiesterases class-II-domain-containing protein [Terfezia claveryi]
MQGSGGGPSEDNVSGHILKSAGQPWKENSLLAVDAGVHLSGIINILEDHKDSNTQSSQDRAISICPFSEAHLPFKSSRANAGHIFRELVSAFLITHSHLDHISGLAIATAALKNVKKCKRIAALPHTITALRKHIFNDFIWPNLSDEDGGVGLVSYLRLPEAASEYIWVAEGLSVQAWPVSHGHCMRKHNHRGSNAGLRASISSLQGAQTPAICEQPCVFDSTTYFIRDEITLGEVLMWGDVEPDSISLSPRNFEVWAVAAKKVYEGKLRAVFIECSFDNTQADACLYGHLNPRHLYEELTTLAKQVVLLREETAQDALLQREASTDIEMDTEWKSSRKRKRMNAGWSDGQRNPGRRWGDGPRVILEEYFDGEPVGPAGSDQEDRLAIRRNSAGGVSPKCTVSDPEEEPSEFALSQPDGIIKSDQFSVLENRDGPGIFGLDGHNNGGDKAPEIDFSLRPLDGLLIVVNHVKDSLEDDVDTVERVYADLQELEKKHNLGCTFVMAKKGLTIFF